jgi:hypothetical protein
VSEIPEVRSVMSAGDRPISGLARERECKDGY